MSEQVRHEVGDEKKTTRLEEASEKAQKVKSAKLRSESHTAIPWFSGTIFDEGDQVHQLKRFIAIRRSIEEMYLPCKLKSLHISAFPVS